MKVSYFKIQNTITAINAIENISRSPKALLALSRNLDKLNKEIEVYIAAKKRLWHDVFGDCEEVERTNPKIAEFNKADKELAEAEIDFQPTLFSMKDLNLENLSIAPKVFNAITWLISDYEAK